MPLTRALIASTRWELEIDSKKMAVVGFAGVNFAVQEGDTISLLGGTGLVKAKVPGNLEKFEFSVSRQVDDDMYFWEWIGTPMVRSGQLSGFRADDSHKIVPAYSWEFTNALPTKVALSGLDASNSGVVTEDITLQAESMKRVK